MTKLTKEQCLNLVISKQIIAKAIRYRACFPAINWLSEKPRTIGELIQHDKNWIRWFIYNVPVGRVYREILHTVYPAVKTWYKNGKLHRDNDLPAVINNNNGTKYWYKNGNLHRDNDKPARVYSDGTQEWYKNGKLHRDNAKPAVIYEDGTKYWYENGVYIKSVDHD